MSGRPSTPAGPPGGHVPPANKISLRRIEMDLSSAAPAEDRHDPAEHWIGCGVRRYSRSPAPAPDLYPTAYSCSGSPGVNKSWALLRYPVCSLKLRPMADVASDALYPNVEQTTGSSVLLQFVGLISSFHGIKFTSLLASRYKINNVFTSRDF